MAALLLTRDARALRALGRPRWLSRALRVTIMAAAVAVLTLHDATAPTRHCTDSAPCAPDPVSAMTVGLLFAAGVAGLLHPRTAGWLAAAFTAAVVSYDLSHPALASPTWVYAVDLGFAGFCFAVAALGRGPHPSGAARAWLADARHERPPTPRALPRIGVGWLVVAAMCLLTAVGVAGATWHRQATVAAREDAAVPLTVDVVARVDADTVRVRLPDRRFAELAVRAADHPVGQRMPARVDRNGVVQPISDPYDVTGWFALAVAAAGVAAACRGRAADRFAGLRELFTQPQPVSQVYVRAGLGVTAVYPGDARPGEPAATELSCLSAPPVVDLPTDDPGAGRVLILPTRPALLYGVPAAGRWCTVVVDGDPVLPTGPVPADVHAPPFSEPTADGGPEPMSAQWTDDDELSGLDAALAAPHRGDLPLRPEEVAAIDPADSDDNPYQVHVHAQARPIGYTLIAGTPLVLLTPVGLLVTLSTTAAVLLAAVVMAASCAVGFRLLLRSRLAWNRGGVAVVGAAGSARLGWQQVRGIEYGRHDVTIHTTDGGLVVAAHDHSSGLGRTGRGAEQLAHALRYAKEMARRSVDPPRLAVPTAPAALYLLWLAGTPALAWTLHQLSAR
ncbi:MAG: hypothetical protein QOE03_837 [Micromonosporaceae bacterium]|nr:hypothetical protein [Micromonosporaceae bacterium]